MGEIWKCKTCGNINMGYVETCGCGGLKEDGIQLNEEKLSVEQSNSKKEERKMWQCPECLKINDRDYCICGYVKTNADKYIDENVNIEQPTNSTKSSYKKNAIIATIVAVVAVISILVGKNIISSRLENKEDSLYYDFIEITADSPTGAVFDVYFSDVKSMVGRELSIGDLSSTSGGWQVTNTSPYITEYGIKGIYWTVYVWVAENGKVNRVMCKTRGMNQGEPSDSEIKYFTKLFSEITGTTQNSMENVFRDVYSSYYGVEYLFKGGLMCEVIKVNMDYYFSITAETGERFFNGIDYGFE